MATRNWFPLLAAVVSLVLVAVGISVCFVLLATLEADPESWESRYLNTRPLTHAGSAVVVVTVYGVKLVVVEPLWRSAPLICLIVMWGLLLTMATLYGMGQVMWSGQCCCCRTDGVDDEIVDDTSSGYEHSDV
jgi:hypothetical protein